MDGETSDSADETATRKSVIDAMRQRSQQNDASREGPVSRRMFLKMLGASTTLGIAAAAGLGHIGDRVHTGRRKPSILPTGLQAGGGQSPLPGPNRDPWPEALWTHPEPDIQNTVTLNVSPGQDITGPLEDALDDHTRIEIPAGAYDFSDRTVLGGTWEHMHVVGLGETPGGVTLDIGTGQGGSLGVRTDSDGSVVILENIDIAGTVSGRSRGFRVDAQHPNSEIILKRYRLLDGEERNSDGTAGWYAGSMRESGDNGNEGTIRFLWSMANKFGDNGIYVDGPTSPEFASSDDGYGQIIVVGGLYSNSNISNIRLGMPYSTVYGATILMDDPVSHSSGKNYRGMRWRRPSADDRIPVKWPEYNHLFVNSDIYYDDVDTEGGRPMVFASKLVQHSNGIVKDVRIHNDATGPAIQDKTSWGVDSTWEFINVHVTGRYTDVDVNLQDSPDPGSSSADTASTDPWWGDGAAPASTGLSDSSGSQPC